MPDSTLSGLTPQEASDICMNQCGAKCCQGPAILVLTVEEARTFEERAQSLGLTAIIIDAPSGF